MTCDSVSRRQLPSRNLKNLVCFECTKNIKKRHRFLGDSKLGERSNHSLSNQKICLLEMKMKPHSKIFCKYFLRSEKKVGLKQIVICSKQAETWALLHKIYFLGLFMSYNWYFIIFCIKTSALEENKDFLNIPKKILSKICKKWAIILTLLVFWEK